MSEQRWQVADAAVAAERIDCVLAVDVIPASQDPTEHWVLDLLVAERDRRPGIPTAIHELLAEHDLHSLRAGPQGPDYRQIVAIA